MTELEKAKRIREISNEIIKYYVKDNKGGKVSEQDRAVELLARAIHEFSEIYLNKYIDDDELLKGILAKVKIASNTLDQAKKSKVIIKRV
ncbi:hypothetical protein [Metabacillus schmidteae]|uniref:hypothetical protein n=1 Tax=Metabacillus schmidteae TaxID=2730405 RepID=UPI00158CD8F1|nr:hypothetical protein [Metabacillus schmidteae]